jgi:hypothetical protein
MNRNIARQIAETITNEQLQEMFETAKTQITNWSKTSSINKGMTVGTSWNILASDFDVNYNYHIMAKTNMIREFGEFLPTNIKPKQKNKKSKNTPVIHQNPVFK